MSAIGEILIDILLRIVLWVILLPLSIILVTPFILIGSAFTKQTYGKSVKSWYYNVFTFWERILTYF